MIKLQVDRGIEKVIKKAKAEDAEKIAVLAVRMWSKSTARELANEFLNIISQEDGEVFLKYDQGELVGFAQCQLRYDYVEGTNTSPVGYLEGIFVKENCRHRGYAKELLSECEKWAKEKGCSEFASDCEIENDCSLRFHMAMDFEETNRIICFVKKL